MVVQIEMLTGTSPRFVFVSQEKADAFIGAGFARLSARPSPIGIGLDIETPGKPRLGIPPQPYVGPVDRFGKPRQWKYALTPIDQVDPVTGYDVDVMQFESPGPTGGSAVYVKETPVTTPAGVPVKTDPQTRIGETVSTGRPATVMGGVMPRQMPSGTYRVLPGEGGGHKSWTGRLPGGGTVGAPRSGSDDPSTMPGGLPRNGLTSLLPISPRVSRIFKNSVPVAAHVACRILTKGRMSGPQSKALCGLLAAGLKRAIG